MITLAIYLTPHTTPNITKTSILEMWGSKRKICSRVSFTQDEVDAYFDVWTDILKVKMDSYKTFNGAVNSSPFIDNPSTTISLLGCIALEVLNLFFPLWFPSPLPKNKTNSSSNQLGYVLTIIHGWFSFSLHFHTWVLPFAPLGYFKVRLF